MHCSDSNEGRGGGRNEWVKARVSCQLYYIIIEMKAQDLTNFRPVRRGLFIGS
jgi:hypothetical protein